MCGIFGAFGGDFSEIDMCLLKLSHRGPNNTSKLSIPGVGVLGHTRLSIIDLDDRSNQPYTSKCGRYVIVFNGEIYNYKRLRCQLEVDGVVFSTSSDTEVLLEWIIKHGKGGLKFLEGMFAFSFYDKVLNKIFVARDPIGEKPLYYTLLPNNKKFAFASEIKALLTVPYVDKSFREECLGDFLRFLYVPAPKTFFNGILELLPGHWLDVDLFNFASSSEAYYDLETSIIDYKTFVPMNLGSLKFGAQLEESVELQLQSDVPVAVYLSAGYDSNAIVACAFKRNTLKDLSFFTAKFSSNDESTFVKDIAKFYKVDCRIVSFDLDMPIEEALERTNEIFDQPFGNSTSIIADKMAGTVSQHCKVALLGDGGDELTVGYPRYAALKFHALIRKFPVFIRRFSFLFFHLLSKILPFSPTLNNCAEVLHDCKFPPAKAYLNWQTYLTDQEVSEALGKQFKSEFAAGLESCFNRHSSNLFRAAAIVDFKSFVPYNLIQCGDRTSMANSIEVRCPFLYPPLIHKSLGLCDRTRFSYIKRKPLISKYFKAFMSTIVFKQKKRPFNPPIDSYLRNNLAFVEDYIHSKNSKLLKYISSTLIQSKLSEFKNKSSSNATFIWGLCTLERWLRKYT